MKKEEVFNIEIIENFDGMTICSGYKNVWKMSPEIAYDLLEALLRAKDEYTNEQELRFKCMVNRFESELTKRDLLDTKEPKQ